MSAASPEARGKRLRLPRTVTALLGTAAVLGVCTASAATSTPASSPGDAARSSAQPTTAAPAKTAKPVATVVHAPATQASAAVHPTTANAKPAPTAHAPAQAQVAHAPAAKAPSVATPSAAQVAHRPVATPVAAKPVAQVASTHATAPAMTVSRPGAKPTAAPTTTLPRALARGPATHPPIQSPTEVEQRISYQYDTEGRRDPFAPLIGGFVAANEGGDAPVDVGGLKVVGIVWGADQFALVEDARGNSLILRRGDKVMNGVVDELKKDAMVVKLTTDGQTQSVAIPLTRKGERAK